MLKQIEIENFVFFKKAVLKFHPRFNVFTGETGAGKTIFLSALGLTLGEKISLQTIRVGEKKSAVTSEFDITDRLSLKKKIKELQLDHKKPNRLILRREITKGGNSQSFINGKVSTTDNLRLIARQLIDIHSQHKNQTLLNPKFHLYYLDQFSQLKNQIESFKTLYCLFKKKQQQLSEIISEENKIKEEKEFLEFTLKDLGAIVTPKEYENTKNQLDYLEKEQKKSEYFYQINENLNEVLSKLGQSINLLENLKDSSQHNFSLFKKLSSSFLEIENEKKNLSENLNLSRDYNQEIDNLNSKLAETEKKLKKYSLSIEAMIEKKQKVIEKLNFLDKSTFEKNQIDKDINLIQKKLLTEGDNLHQLRIQAAQKLESQISQEFHYLGMSQGRLLINLKSLSIKEMNEMGVSKVEFLYSPAKEIKPKPLKKVASGGEISRMMLAMKKVLNEKFLQTIVFDEIDTGVGGETALHVGEKIKEISSQKQVIIITHLPQIAKFADQHFKIEKKLDTQGMSYSEIISLTSKGILEEFARMLGAKKKEEDKKSNLEIAKEFLKK